MRGASAVVIVALLAACGAAGGHARTPPVDAADESAPAVTAPSAATSAVRPDHALTLAETRAYMLALINRDRATMGVAPVELDDAAATRAGQAHAEDMAANGFLGHWGTDGSVPEQRMTEAGGDDMVMENASCFVDTKQRTLDPDARIEPENVEKAEDMFFHETPPLDGHRRNILKAWHTKVGIGVAQPVRTQTEIPVPCFSQEFVDHYGTYAPVPRTMRVGGTLHVEAYITAPAKPAGIGLARVGAPKALSADEANRRRSYPVPEPYQLYWPPGYRTPIPVSVTADSMSIDVPVSQGGAPGMYELSIWAKLPGVKELVMVGLRTIEVER